MKTIEEIYKDMNEIFYEPFVSIRKDRTITILCRDFVSERYNMIEREGYQVVAVHPHNETFIKVSIREKITIETN